MTSTDRRNSVAEGTAVKAPCRAATTANITLSGQQTIDGVACVAGDRVLVKNQSTGSQNGIYDVSTGNWTRSRDFDGAFDIVSGTRVFVVSGSLSAQTEYFVSTTGTITIDSTSIAFTSIVSTAVGAAAAAATLLGQTWTTGDIKLTLKDTADTGWRLFDDGTIGDGSSSATYANVLAVDLFTLLFNKINDTNCPILTSSGSATTRAAQTSAATAWAAHCRMSLPKTLGRALAIAGSGSGLTSRTLGQKVGAETVTLLTANLPAYTPGGTNSSISVTSTEDNIPSNQTVSSSSNSGGARNQADWGALSTTVGKIHSTGSAPTFTGTAQGGTSTPVSIVPAEVFLNAMVKL